MPHGRQAPSGGTATTILFTVREGLVTFMESSLDG
jgi:hypothetical protein